MKFIISKSLNKSNNYFRFYMFLSTYIHDTYIYDVMRHIIIKNNIDSDKICFKFYDFKIK